MENYTISCIVVDTINAIQNNQYAAKLKKQGSVKHSDWTDYGVDIYLFMETLKSLGFELVLVLGKEGSGKSFGMKGLDPGSYIWFNADNKNPTFIRADKHKELYGKKTSPGIMMRIPQTYGEIIDNCAQLKAGVTTPDFSMKLSDTPIAFLLGHTEEYRTQDGEVCQRLRVLGNLATKMQIEGQVETCVYATMNIVDKKPVGYLRTQNSGTDTARTTEGMFPLHIPNDFKLILDAINNN